MRIGVDIGGTFTDCVVVDERGERYVAKSLTTHEGLSTGVLSALSVVADEIGERPADVDAEREVTPGARFGHPQRGRACRFLRDGAPLRHRHQAAP